MNKSQLSPLSAVIGQEGGTKFEANHKAKNCKIKATQTILETQDKI